MLGLLDYFSIIVFGGLVLLDFIMPARRFPRVTLWRLKGIVATVTYVAIATYSPFLWDSILADYQLIDGSAWPFHIAAPAALLLYQFGVYVLHRTMHASPFLWRHSHQTHHSAERVDIWGALYFHPIDIIGFSFVGSLCLTLILGVEPEAILFALLVSTFCGFFQHANLNTPRWLGFIITRPESHTLHHKRGVHHFNYGDIPIWDMLFGTFRNPKVWEGEAGFYDGASSRYFDLLIGRDISQDENTVETAHLANAED